MVWALARVAFVATCVPMLWAAASSAALVVVNYDAQGSWPNMTIAEISKSFWGPMGPRMPDKAFIKAVEAASLVAVDGRGQPRRLVIMCITSASTFSDGGLWQLFLTNMRNITFTRRDGTKDNLARHVVAVMMTVPGGSVRQCSKISKPYGARCVPITCPIFTRDTYGYKTAPFYGISFAKTLTIANALTLGVDVFFLDVDQVFFRNPLPYILARDIDVLLSGDCMRRQDVVPQKEFPRVASNIGVMYLRAKPMVTRAVTDWLHHLVYRAAHDSPTLDQSSSNRALEWRSSDVGAQVMSVGMLQGEHFPNYCMGVCGCDTEGLEPDVLAPRTSLLPDGTCWDELMRKWYNFHVPCGGDLNKKASTLNDRLRMYTAKIGPVNSLSDPLDAL